MDVIETPVLIVGGAGCGLASAIFLSELGIASYLIERHPSTSPAPKAHYINPRTMELFREVGLADAVYARGAPLENMRRVGWYTSLGGDGALDRKTIALMDSFGGGSLRATYESHSPCRATNFPQLRLEPFMYEHALRHSRATLNYHHELVDFSQNAGGVLATVLNRDDGTTYQVRARYMIAADGGRKVGPALDIPMDGIPRLFDMVTAHFAGDLSPYIDDDTPMIRWFNNPANCGGTWGSGVIVAMGPERWDRHSEEWLCHFSFMPDDPEQFDETSIVPRLRDLLGLPELEIKIIKMNNWQVQAVLARQFQIGRIFLAGDAAHRHPPTTGLGLNSAIQDAHNLAWKLALVLNGKADAHLLDSYEPERRGVTASNVEWAMFTFQNHIAIDAGIGLIPGAPPEFNREAFRLLFSDTRIGVARRARLAEIVRTQRAEFQAHDIEMGFVYTSDAVVPDGSPAPSPSALGDEYTPLARPGHRLPHAWLTRGGKKISTLDLAGRGRFVLLTGGRDGTWREAAKAAATQSGVEIDVISIGPAGDCDNPDGTWAALRGTGDDGAVLVRPDGHVGWRAPDAARTRALGDAFAQILGRKKVAKAHAAQ